MHEKKRAVNAANGPGKRPVLLDSVCSSDLEGRTGIIENLPEVIGDVVRCAAATEDQVC